MKKANQKELIHLMCKSTDTTIKELAIHLGIEPNSLSVTLNRSNLLFDHFLKIYEYIYKEQFNIGVELLYCMKSTNKMPLKYAVDMMSAYNTPIIVTTYKKTKVQLINTI